MTVDQEAADVSNPQTQPARLQEIAASRPDLWDKIASHPAVYPDLLAWINREGAAQPGTPLPDAAPTASDTTQVSPADTEELEPFKPHNPPLDELTNETRLLGPIRPDPADAQHTDETQVLRAITAGHRTPSRPADDTQVLNPIGPERKPANGRTRVRQRPTSATPQTAPMDADPPSSGAPSGGNPPAQPAVKPTQPNKRPAVIAAVIAGALVLVVGIVFGAGALLGGKPKGGGSPSPSASSTATASAKPSASPSPSPSADPILSVFLDGREWAWSGSAAVASTAAHQETGTIGFQVWLPGERTAMSCQVSPLEEDQELSGGQANKSAKVIGSYGEQPKAFLVYGAITKPSGLHARSLHTYFREIKAPGCELGPAVDLGELPGGDPADSDFEVVEAYATEDRLVTLGKGGSAFHAALAELSGKVVWNSNQSQHKPYILRAVSPEYFVLVSDIVEAFPPDFITSELRSMRTGEVVDAEDCTPQESSSPCDQSWLTAIGGSTVLPGGKDWFTAIGEEGSGIAHFARVTLPGFTSPWGFSEEDPQFQGYNQLLRDPIIALDANLNPTAVGSIGPSRSPAIIGGSQGAFERPLTQAEAQALDLKIVGATNNAIYADTSEGRIILDFDGMTTGSWSSWYPTGDISTPLGRLTMWRNESEDTHWIGPTGTKPDGA